jgi:flagellar biosynthetic protein FlhB
MKHYKKILIPINLQFFESNNSGEKTEAPTARKKRKAREEGQVAKSQEVSTAFLLIVGFFALRVFGGWILDGMTGLFTYQLQFIPDSNEVFELTFLSSYIAWVFGRILVIVAPIFAVVLLVGVIVNLLQVGWHPTLKPLRFKGSKLNPLKGLKRIFSMQALVTLVKSILKFLIILWVIYLVVRREIDFLPMFLDMELLPAVAYIGNLTVMVGLWVGGLYIFIAALDYAYTRYKHFKELKMTKHEVKEEWKQAEGNPLIKGKIKQKMREVSMRRMMQNVPNADVIITNPTHYAVALKYDILKGAAPVLLAKGVDYQAKRIRDVARDNNIEIVENAPLARAIYSEVPVDKEIPPELYEAVAEILAYVFMLKNKAYQ